MKNIILVKYLDDDTKARRIETALAETRVDFQVNLEKQCVIVEETPIWWPLPERLSMISAL